VIGPFEGVRRQAVYIALRYASTPRRSGSGG
jgi:hypothetical protein